MKHFIRDFISEENRKYDFKLGEILASALTGFIVGVVVASIVWMLAFYYMNNVILNPAENPADATPVVPPAASSSAAKKSSSGGDSSGGVSYTVIPSSRVQVIAPSGGEVWERGQTYNVQWDISDFPSGIPVSAILIRTDSVITNPFTKGATSKGSYQMFYSSMFPKGFPMKGSYSYRVPDTISAGTYQVAILAGQTCASGPTGCEYNVSRRLFTIK